MMYKTLTFRYTVVLEIHSVLQNSNGMVVQFRQYSGPEIIGFLLYFCALQ